MFFIIHYPLWPHLKWELEHVIFGSCTGFVICFLLVYLFHYICQDRIVYLCITNDDFERSRAFNFLNEIKKRFQTTYGSRAQTALPYAMNSEFSSVLAAQLKHHSENKGLDKVMETQAQVDELKGIMVRNIGERNTLGERSKDTRELRERSEDRSPKPLKPEAYLRKAQQTLAICLPM
ncbi:vesicle-associated membrane protein 7 isoform X3 [Choloepus didactylus]|uniref:vesicle-associated membrane protein 7 isoform X3 n=1 Tax=Choloepus didactylus TaxID=27675 RepID=UPI0018A04667|nr:vesicle-associated membrane protein 7 isoform X3 [Choloepus didactylus]